MTRNVLIPFVVFALGVAGCQSKLTVTKTIKVPDGEFVAKIVEMPAQATAQKVTVSVNVTAGSPVDVYILRASDIGDEVAGDKKEKKEWDGKAFSSKQGLTNATVTGTVPANTAFKVVVVPAEGAKEPSTVELKITN